MHSYHIHPQLHLTKHLHGGYNYFALAVKVTHTFTIYSSHTFRWRELSQVLSKISIILCLKTHIPERKVRMQCYNIQYHLTTHLPRKAIRYPCIINTYIRNSINLVTCLSLRVSLSLSLRVSLCLCLSVSLCLCHITQVMNDI